MEPSIVTDTQNPIIQLAAEFKVNLGYREKPWLKNVIKNTKISILLRKHFKYKLFILDTQSFHKDGSHLKVRILSV